jgi:3-deoxy-D-manno-octulosonic-acid transferase
MNPLYSVAIEVVTWMLLVPLELLRVLLGRSSLAALRERLGGYEPDAVSSGKRLLIHAVSAGEMSAASALVHELASRGWAFVLSAGNEDALSIARRIAGCHAEVERVVRFPWDRPRAMRRFLAGVSPDAVVVMETELWPGLFGACRALGIPLVIAGARIERGAAARYRLARRFFARMLEGCSAILAINGEEGERFAAIGTPRERITIAGELKAEACLSSHESAPAERKSGPLIVAVSTHPGEEEVVLRAFGELREAVPDARLIIAPRHVRRAAAVRALVRGPGITVIDRMGELSSLLRGAEVAVVGGTFVAIGGHDLFEPARAGCAIVIGPHVDNIRATVSSMLAADALSSATAADLGSMLIELLRSPERRTLLAASAVRFAESRRGVARLSGDCIEAALLKQASCVPPARGPLATLIRKWETLHPYNFVKLIDLSRPVEAATLERAAQETLVEMLGMGASVPCSSAVDAEAELARGFSDAEAPVRMGWAASLQLAFTFRHACFDGAGAALFVQRTLRRALGETLDRIRIGRSRERVDVRHLPRTIGDLLRMRRVASRSGVPGESPLNRLRFIDGDARLLERLHVDAAEHHATINDVLAARLAEAMCRVGPVGEGRRANTAITIAVGMRRKREPFTRDVAAAWFPVFTGKRPTVDDIRAQTLREKRSASWMRSRTEMRIASILWHWIAPAQRGRYFARQYVVTAGLTTLRVEDSPFVAAYRGVVATGPVAPLVVTALIKGERLTLGIAWKAARFRDEEIDRIAETLVI